jgi:TolB-like protein/Tfp pilus assembly protein PilF
MPLIPGEMLAHYRIEHQIGQGGMGAVFLAEDTKLDRKVALKVLPPGMSSDPDRLARFQREARAVAALNHPHIVTLFAVEEDGGTHFLTMELVEGESLDRRLPPGGLPLAQVFDVGIALADALAAAHDKGIIHRDLKPANVMFTQDGRVKVLDFGLAKLTAESGPSGAAGEGGAADPTSAPTAMSGRERSLTEAGAVMGTVPYMSPEQLHAKEVDHRTDVFSLGVILYEMTTGQRPFSGKSAADTMSSILRDTPPPLHVRDASLPRHLGRIVTHCLEKDPEQRYQSAKDIRNELRALRREVESDVSGVSPASGAVPGSAVPAPRAGAPRWLWPVAGVAAMALIAAAVVVMRPWGEGGGPAATVIESAPDPAAPAVADARKRIAVLPLENLGPAEDAYFAAGVTDEITSRLAGVGDLVVISRASASQYDRSGKTMEQIGRDLGVDYVLEGTVRWQKVAGGESRVRVTPQLIDVSRDAQLWSDRYDQAMEDIFQVQSEIAANVVEQLGLTLDGTALETVEARPTENMEAYQTYLEAKDLIENGDGGGEFIEGMRLLERAVELDPEFAGAWAYLSVGHSAFHHFRVDLTEENLTRAREEADRALRIAPDLADARKALGTYYYWGRRDYDRALQEFYKVHAWEDDADVLQFVAAILRRQGRYDDAVVNMEKAKLLDPQNPARAGELVLMYSLVGRWEDSEREVNRAIAMRPDEPGMYMAKANFLKNKGDPQAVRSALERVRSEGRSDWMEMMIQVDLAEGRYEEALERIRAADFDALQSQSIYHPREYLEALAYLLSGQTDRSRSGFEAARQKLEEKIEEDPKDPRYHAFLGLTYAFLGRGEEAVREATLATDLHPVTRDHLEGSYWLALLAQVHAWAGDPDAALDVLEPLVGYAPVYGTSRGTLSTDPMWTPLRGNPRFEALKKKAL